MVQRASHLALHTLANAHHSYHRHNSHNNTQHGQYAAPLSAANTAQRHAQVSAHHRAHFLLLARLAVVLRDRLACLLGEVFGLPALSPPGTDFIRVETPARSSSSVFTGRLNITLRAMGAISPMAVFSSCTILPSCMLNTRGA